ncbi:hypothetical protein BHM03_00014463 [Ensete ventricosum]|nr:hypothetical protein BHM03_00014463 [Ensete ventricosum]
MRMAKEIAAIKVQGYRALTSLIFGLSPLMNVPNNCLTNQSRVSFVRLGDLPILNSAKRAHSLFSIRVSKASNLAPIRSTDAMA